MSKLDRVAAIIVAAGMGVRMGGEKKKQYHILAYRPVLAHTLLLFDKCDLIEEIFLVISEDDYDVCRHQVIDPFT
ncbi:MAG: 2-C-methyl-D-erythritol 4-phosphate cytidylyltransferase [Deltaproteobacteria bacterium]|nr:2-C-methyl-D-erythritol 4-phosphate cytidylyltransferase [Deltaproteobacteria bacterium]